MKTLSVNRVERDVITVFANHYPFPYEKIKELYMKVDSYDLLEQVLNLSLKFNVSTSNILKIIGKGL